MKRYLVGGAVRDALLGLPVGDRDWVIVGADVDALRRGRLPARSAPTSRSSSIPRRTRSTRSRAPSARPAPGYRGFAFHAGPEVTLEEDLLRRDLTINAIAEDEDGVLIDPFGGRPTSSTKVLRHVSPAFAEDPVRILRLARFAARFADFTRRARDRGADAADGRGRRGRCAGAGARLARGLARPDGAKARRGCSRCCAHAARSRGCCPRSTRLFGVPQRADYHPEVDTGVHLMMVLDMAARLGSLARGALRLPRPRPRQGHDAGRDPAEAHAPRGAQRRPGAAR